MVKIYIASFNRASDGAIKKLKKKMIEKDLHTEDYKEADYILAVGDRTETFNFVLERYRENIPIIHLWAGEKSDFEVHDDVYRHSMTLMSDIHLCTNREAQNRVTNLCKAVDKSHKSYVVGNVMLDNLEIDESNVPSYSYIVILYNPPTRTNTMEAELKEIRELIDKYSMHHYIWLPANGDKGSERIQNFVTSPNQPREKFLGLLKNCRYFITNSSCQYYEAPYVMTRNKIIPIGERNKERESKYGDMGIPGATDNIIRIFERL